MRYTGGKGVSYAQIINLMPPHRQYIETHLGGGAVMRHKKAAAKQIGIEIDASVVEIWKQMDEVPCNIIHGDAISVLKELNIDMETVIYVDPPYYPETRKRKKIYKFDYTADDHVELINYLLTVQGKILISGYRSDLYCSELKHWNVHSFNAKTHSGNREELVWYNFEKPTLLHDDRYFGNNFREREIIKRRSERLKRRILQLSHVEQAMLLEWLNCNMIERAVL